jgi:hypothetical protein
VKYGINAEPVREKYNTNVIRYITSTQFVKNVWGFGSIEVKFQLQMYIEAFLLEANLYV